MDGQDETEPPARPSDPTIIRRGRGAGNPAESPDGDGDGDGSTPRSHADASTEATVSLDPDQAIRAVLLSEEATRVRAFALATILLASMVAIALPLLGGDALASRICGAALAFNLGVALWVLHRTGPDGEYTRNVFRTQAWVQATAILGIEYYIGFYSPVTVVLSLGIYYIGQAHDRVTALGASLWAIVGWAGSCVLVTAGVLEERSLFPSSQLELQTKVFIIVAVTASLAMTLAMARLAHRSVRRAIKQGSDAVVVARKQAAELAEAKNQLDRAMKLAVGKPGQHTGQLAGDCELGVLIGLGAMGEVYDATHQQTRTKVAVKLLHDAARKSPDLLERFLREAEICQQLDHPHLVGVQGAGTLDNGEPYLIMEHLVGEDLGAILRAKRSLPLADVRTLCNEVAAGLQHAHAHGVIHRDLKPHNLFLVTVEGQEPRWKVLDFGISRYVDASGTLTRGGVVGTPAYMSPEQARGKRLDGRSDVFALAAVVYRALTGRPAFPGGDTPRIMFDVAYRQPDKPSSQVEGIPGDVDLALAVGLAKDPDDRFESAPAFARALSAAARRRLPESVRLRANTLLARQPWGFSPDQPSPRASDADRPTGR